MVAELSVVRRRWTVPLHLLLVLAIHVVLQPINNMIQCKENTVYRLNIRLKKCHNFLTFRIQLFVSREIIKNHQIIQPWYKTLIKSGSKDILRVLEL